MLILIPLFSAIVLSKNLPFSPGFRRFSRKKDPGKNGEGTPRFIAGYFWRVAFLNHFRGYFGRGSFGFHQAVA